MDEFTNRRYEFGNTGCAELAGLVTDERGAPIDGAYVSVLGPAEPARLIVLRWAPQGRWTVCWRPWRFVRWVNTQW